LTYTAMSSVDFLHNATQYPFIMKHALERINDFVSQLAKTTEKTTVILEQSSEWLSLVKLERKNIKTYLSRKSFKVKSPVELQLIIRKFQLEITRLANRLYQITSKRDKDDVKLITPIVVELNSIVLKIKEWYPEFFDNKQEMPDVYREEVVKPDLQKRIKAIHSRIKNEVDPALIEIVLKSLMESTKTYEQLKYSQTVLDSISEIPELLKHKLIEEITNQQVINALISVNFNCVAFTSYIFQQISKAISSADSASEKRNWLILQRKNVRQVFRTTLAFKPKNEPVREQVCKWIELELEYVEIGANASIELLQELPEQLKLHFGISEEELTLFAKAAKDTKLILNESLTSIFKSLPNFCRTVKAKRLTGKGLRRSHYEATEHHIDNSIDHLHDMINALRKYRT
jgi:hypothetical protein